MIALGVLVGALWLRGQYVSDTFRLAAGSGYTLHAFCGQGSVAFVVTTGGDFFKDKPDGSQKDWWFYSAARPPIDFHSRWANLGDETRFNEAGVVVIREPTRGTVFGLLAPCMPAAPVLPGFAVARLLWYRLYTRRRRRVLAGLCPDCGHDMRTLTERCPNCGRPRTRGGMRIGRVRNAPDKRAA